MRINLGLALLALLISITLWVLVVNDQNPERTDTPDIAIPVEVTKIQSGLVLMNNPEPVRFKIQAPRDRWSGFRASSFQASVDLSRVGPGIQSVPIIADASDPQVHVLEVIPPTASIRLEEVRERTVPVKVNLVGNVPFGYVYGKPKVDPEVLVVSGPSSLVQSVDTASVDVRLDGITVDIDAAFHPSPVDSTGNTVRNVKLSVETARVQLSVQQQVSYKQLGIRPNLTGNPAGGYWVESVVSEPASVTVVGDPKVLAGVDYLDTAPVDVGNATSSVVQDVRVVTPQGVSLVQQQQTVRVRANVSPLQSSQIVRVAPRVVNLDPRLRVLGLPPYLDVTVQGPTPAMQSVNVDNVTVTVDAAGLGEGTFNLKPIVRVPSGVQLAGVSPDSLTVLLSQNQAPATSTPTPGASGAPTGPTPTPTAGR
ncbi:MAG TPA: CdaR family protein [Chloroflexota bacterium]